MKDQDPKSPKVNITKEDHIEDKALDIIDKKLGWMAHSDHHEHSLLVNILHKLGIMKHHHHHHHHHDKTYLDENPDFYTVNISYILLTLLVNDQKRKNQTNSLRF